MRSVQSTLFALLVASSAAYADTTFNLTRGVSPISHDVYELHMTVFWICVAMGILVFGAMFYAMFYHRKSRGAVPAQFHSHPWLEITWTIVPVIILILMAIPATKVLLNMNNNDQEELTIKITGYQWKWHYEYLEDGVSFFSNLSTPIAQLKNEAPKGEYYLREVDNALVVPIHKKIRFLITSNDVNHAWWVADLGVKRDAISGFINEAWTKIDKAGIYRGQCAELCGINHAFMPIVVIATTEEGYKDWVAKQKGQATAGEAETAKLWTQQELMTRGEQVYGRICAACHQPGGLGLPPTFPALKGSKITLGATAKHVETVMNGVQGTAMQAFKNQLSDADIAAVITYERNAWGNNVGNIIQPIQIKAYRGGTSIEDALAIQPTQTVGKTGETAKPASTPAPDTAGGSVPKQSDAKVSPQGAATPASVNQAAQGIEGAATGTANAAEPTAPAAAAETKPASAEDLKAAMTRGEKVYMTTCAVCHQPAGIGMPPVFPALKGSKMVTGPVAAHIERVLNGKPGTAMLAFRDQLKDQDLADVVTYERNAWENNTGDLVKPNVIKTARAPKKDNNQ